MSIKAIEKEIITINKIPFWVGGNMAGKIAPKPANTPYKYIVKDRKRNISPAKNNRRLILTLG
jgi:hypothetical protein